MASPTSTTSSSTSSTTIVATSPSCITAIPGPYGFVPPDACNAIWAYSPSFPAAVTFSTLFGLLTLSQIVLAFIFRKRFCWVMVMGCSWELVAFITRSLGSRDQQSLGYAYPSLLLFLLAPLWINAFVYMTAGRLIWTFHPAKKVFGVKATSIGKYFVWLDIVSFLIQCAGGVMLSPEQGSKIMDIGKTVYMSGLGAQQFFIVLFLILIIRFHIDTLRLEQRDSLRSNKKCKWVTYALYIVLALITMRIGFRLAEFSGGMGADNPLPNEEKYSLILDAAPMVLAIFVLTVVHPGLALKGSESEFPSRKERKADNKARKAEKKMSGQEKDAAKKRGDS
ncbi:RTA1 like protein-domain-containing protein [Massariosphaeria phaeospora]|uniref:RTA1 like protein-domain-containing protein n=1 Tax=Massariosphaeria phaeospora TaxID=100035 RepID=A0A7C8IDS7_9PLEO|nr:RTA1 like protein-domain-containing protein [Massariosphaeria phaeospora]